VLEAQNILTKANLKLWSRYFELPIYFY